MNDLLGLARPFPQRLIRSNPSGGGSYVPHPAYSQRLLLTFGGYKFERVEIIRGDVAGKPGDPNGSSARAKAGTPDLHDVIVGVMMRLTIPTGVYENVGDCEQPHNWPHDGARLKDAVSDAKKRCCADAGLGLHLYMGDPKDYVLFDQLKARDAEVSGAGGVAVSTGGTGDQHPAGVGTEGPASEFCDACKAGDCQHCTEREEGDDWGPCDCMHDDGRPM